MSDGDLTDLVISQKHAMYDIAYAACHVYYKWHRLIQPHAAQSLIPYERIDFWQKSTVLGDVLKQLGRYCCLPCIAVVRFVRMCFCCSCTA
jgi:hypothetical protein